MAKSDWYEAGEQIRKLVQDAVDSKDFSQLGTTISNVVNDTVNGLQSSLKENLGRDFGNGAQEGTRNSYEYTNRAAAEQIRRNIAERRKKQAQEAAQAAAATQKSMKVPQAAAVTQKPVKAPGEFAAGVTKWFGYGMGGMMGFSLAVILIVWFTTRESMLLPAAILALLTAIGFGVGSRGAGRLGMARRFRRYQELVGSRKFCQIEELASAVGKSEKFVRRDLSRMMELGFFREGYLDREKRTLITDRATYQQYLTAQTDFENRRAEDRKKKENAGQGEEKPPELTPECRELIAEGRQYIQHVHECNEKIEDPEMSAKLDRLELVITRIFREAERDPEIVGDLKKMMSYYLPTTKKLLDAYCEMSGQPIRGQNIEKTKKEIETALDTINTAFENLLDSFFQDTAWDISSDITVLNTVFAQEGLTGKAFEQKQGGKKDE